MDLPGDTVGTTGGTYCMTSDYHQWENSEIQLGKTKVIFWVALPVFSES